MAFDVRLCICLRHAIESCSDTDYTALVCPFVSQFFTNNIIFRQRDNIKKKWMNQYQYYAFVLSHNLCSYVAHDCEIGNRPNTQPNMRLNISNNVNNVGLCAVEFN